MSTPQAATLDTPTLATITVVARVLYPHAALPDDVYARVGEKLAEAAAADPAAGRMVEEGVSGLNRGRPFAELSTDEQIAALTAIEGSDFFELVRSTAVTEIYADQRTWQLVGYEGPSFDKGGYVNRGFNDLDWLPDPETAR
jgi:hypothetical protein